MELHPSRFKSGPFRLEAANLELYYHASLPAHSGVPATPELKTRSLVQSASSQLRATG